MQIIYSPCEECGCDVEFTRGDHLIAAAPELLGALKEAQHVLETLFIGWECKAENRGKSLQQSPYIALGQARAAIAKAEGK